MAKEICRRTTEKALKSRDIIRLRNKKPQETGILVKVLEITISEDSEIRCILVKPSKGTIIWRATSNVVASTKESHFPDAFSRPAGVSKTMKMKINFFS
jgi:hypothetical protein